MTLQVLIPLQSRTAFYPEKDFYFPKPLIEINGRPMIEWVIAGITNSFGKCKFIFIVDKDDVDSFSLDGVLKNATSENTVIIVKNNITSGAVCSCLLAVDDIDDDAPLLISNGDQFVQSPISTKIDKLGLNEKDGAVVTFPALHPRWCYVKLNNQIVSEFYEKKVVSKSAVAGLYYFAQGKNFKTAATDALLNGFSVEKNFYISGVMNQLILNNGRIHNIKISETEMHTFYDPAQIKPFSLEAQKSQTLNVVIPAAGAGSRFANAGWHSPKPLIDVGGKSMLEHVFANIKVTDSSVKIIARQNVCKKLLKQDEFQDCEIIELKSLTEGTASTILHCRESIDSDAPLLIANSDQLVDFDVNLFVKDCLTRGLDGSILVFKDAHMDPKWSFAKVNDDGLVIEVAEKKAISNFATVGIYLFSSGKEFIASALDMIVNNDRVNGEFYTCPVYNYMIAKGARIGIFEVNPNDMHGLGTPDDLRRYIRLQNYSVSMDDPN